eukprot:TRINITY_DN6116_c1_g1_i1.p1 TRINITY_DN6116_c1_g1~~TRINITY_DN6116_c1_g1_i1.p1  ORF type:complete len:854 (-),score=179.09 TRINITY_DN6116_c1_g1_i1:74-2554(-)
MYASAADSAKVHSILESQTAFARLMNDMSKEFECIQKNIEGIIVENSMLRQCCGKQMEATLSEAAAPPPPDQFQALQELTLSTDDGRATKRPHVAPSICNGINGDLEGELPDNELTELSLSVCNAKTTDINTRRSKPTVKNEKTAKKTEHGIGRGERSTCTTGLHPEERDLDAMTPEEKAAWEEAERLHNEKKALLRSQERRKQFFRLSDQGKLEGIPVTVLIAISELFDDPLEEGSVFAAMACADRLLQNGSELAESAENESNLFFAEKKQGKFLPKPVWKGGHLHVKPVEMPGNEEIDLAMAAGRGGSFMSFKQYLVTMDESICPETSPEYEDMFFTLRSALHAEANDYRNKAILVQDREKLKERALRSRVAVMLDLMSVVVILANSLVIGLSLDHDPEGDFWNVTEFVFFAYYVGEVAVKIWVFGCNYFWCGPDAGWNWFDVLCVMASVCDFIISYVLLDYFIAAGGDPDDMGSFLLVKMFRMARLTRIIRVVRFKMFKELKLIILGLFSGLRALFWAVILLLFLIYALGVVMKTIAGEMEPEFNSVTAAMFTLFRCFTEGCAAYDGTPLTEKLHMKLGGSFVVAYFLISMMVTVGIFNLIMAVFIDNVTKSQQQRKQKEIGETAESIEADLKIQITKFILNPYGLESAEDKATVSSFTERLSEKARGELARLTDDEGAHGHSLKLAAADAAFDVLSTEEVTISRTVFQHWLHDKDFINVLEDADVDISNKFELFDILDVDMGGELSADELVTGLMKLRGDVSKGDIVSIMLKVSYLTRILESLTNQMGTSAQSLLVSSKGNENGEVADAGEPEFGGRVLADL